jgi:hypothetical protein
MHNTITLNTLEQHTIPFESARYAFLFLTPEGEQLSAEHRDQIFCLNAAASRFLWDFDLRVNDQVLLHFPDLKNYFRSVEEYNLRSPAQLKEWLQHCGIAYEQKVYMAVQPDSAFVLTWKMILNYSEHLFFAHDLVIWDRSMDWMLSYHHDDRWYFAKQRMSR